MRSHKNKMKNWGTYLRMSILLAVMSSAHAAFAQSPQQPATSAPSSPTSATPVSNPHVSKGSVDMPGAETSKGTPTWSEPPAVAGGLTPTSGASTSKARTATDAFSGQLQ